jgi:type I restriction enzyme S subunit
MSLAKEFRISISGREVTFNQDIKALQPSEKIDPWFLFYYLKSQKHAIRDSATDASHGTKKLETRVLEQWPFPLLDIPTQRSIASILSAYDDLIENNRRRIQLLEQSARLLYKEWFVHFRFPGNEHTQIIDGVPEGWEKKVLGELSPFKYGKALKADNRIPGAYPVYGSSGIVGTHNKALVPGPAIIVGRKGNVGSVYWSKSAFYPIDTVYFIGAEHCSLYLYYALLHTQFISTDVAVPGLNRDYAHSRLLLVPERKILLLFEQHAEVMHNQIERLTIYNESLTSARDLLLPRLMNGEIAV